MGNLEVLYACWFAILLVFFQVAASLAHIYFRELAAMKDAMECFKVADTICHDEADRPKVYGLIAAFMCFKGFVAPGASREVALQEFEVLVRKHVGRLVDAMFGLDTKAGLKYKVVLVIFSIWPLRLGDVLGAKLARSSPWTEIFMVALYYLSSWFFTIPVVLVVFLFFCKKCQVESPFKRRAFVSGMMMIIMPLWVAIDQAGVELFVGIAGRPGAHVGWYLLIAALLCAEGAATWWLYRRPSGEHQALSVGSRPAILSEFRRSIKTRMGSPPVRGRDKLSMWSWTSRGTSCDVPPLRALPNGTSPAGDPQDPLRSVVFESI